MKKNKWTWLVFLVLVAVSAVLWMSRSKSSLKGELRDFAYADTAAVDQIFMADRDGRQVTLKRKAGGFWEINGKYVARKDAIDNLLYTIKSVEVRSPVGRNLYENTMKLMAAKSVKVEVYANGENVKTYYVGHPTMDNLGTFMYIEGSTVPYITHIPGFNGFLSTRYFASEAEWRDKSIFRFDPRKITRISIVENIRTERSFVIERQADSSYTVLKTKGSEYINPLDINKIRAFLSGFSQTFYERIDNDFPRSSRDSLFGSTPFARIEVTMDDGSAKSLTCFRKPVTTGSRVQLDEKGEPLAFDLDKFYALMGNDSTLLVCQYFHFDRIMKDPRNLMPGPDVVPAQQRF